MNRLFLAGVLLAIAAITSPVFAGDDRQDIHVTAQQAQPLLPGMMAPTFTVRDVQGEEVNFDPASMQKPLVLSFFRGGWCPYCNLHLSEMRHAEAELIRMGFDVWFISMDKPELLAASLDEPDLAYRLLSDTKLQATRAFGIAFAVDEETRQKYLTMNIDLEAVSGENHHVLPVPSTYIIGVDGKINFQYTNVDYHVRLHPDVLLAAAKAYQDNADKRLQQRRAAQRAAAKQ